MAACCSPAYSIPVVQQQPAPNPLLDCLLPPLPLAACDCLQTEEYLNNRGLFEMKARQHVATHAQCCTCSAPPGGASAAVVPAALPAAGVVEGAGEPPIAPAAGAASSSEAAALPAMGSSGGQPASAAQQPDAVAAGNAATPGSRAAGVGAENEAPAHGVHQHPEGGGAAQALVKRRRLGMGQGKPMAEAVNQAG